MVPVVPMPVCGMLDNSVMGNNPGQIGSARTINFAGDHINVNIHNGGVSATINSLFQPANGNFPNAKSACLLYGITAPVFPT